MNIALIKRHCMIFFRDKSAVFFAILASIIVIGINTFLLSNVYVTSFTEVGFPYDHAMIFVTTWTICGALAINAVTVPLSFVGFVVADKQNDIMKDFKSSAIKPASLSISYVVSAMLVTLAINVPIMIGLISYLASNNALYLSLFEGISFLSIYCLAILLFSLIGVFLTKFIKTQSAHSGLIGVCSAFLGFLGAIYMPIGNFDGVMKMVITLNPLTMLGMVIKDTFMSGFIQEMRLPQDLLAYFGVTLEAFNYEFTTLFVVGVLLISCLCIFCLNSVVQEKS